jgi:predicted ATPase
MILKAFRIQMYKCFIDSGWIEVAPLTVLVGKNESGKTALLKALHKFNPFKAEPYSMGREWPRGRRADRSDAQVVCTSRFELTPEEIQELAGLTNQKMTATTIEITRDYTGRVEVLFPSDIFPDNLHPNDIDAACASLSTLQEPVGDNFKQKAQECIGEARRLAHEGRFTELAQLHATHSSVLRGTFTPGNPQPQHNHEEGFVSQYTGKLNEISKKLSATPSIQKKAHEYVVSKIPTFIYMSEYLAFTGASQLDQVKQRKDRKQLTEEDKTLLIIMELSGLNLEDEVRKGSSSDREQRQYDLDDASATLTNTIADRWKQRRYEVQFRADGHFFFTFVKDEHDPSLIQLEERSRGFQWFFSFDLMFMYESKGTFKNCIILLDEPGLHLHPDAQKDLLKRMEEYARENTLLYTTHLPFMIDLQKPERIRILSEKGKGSFVTDDFTQSQPEAKFVLQAALGMSGSSSYLVAQRNLVVEGVDDFWILTQLSRLMKSSGEASLPDDMLITPAGGASEAVYITTFMVGQKLHVVALFDSDRAGYEARDSLVKKWLTKYQYQSKYAQALNLGDCVQVANREFSIEDIFPKEFYLQKVQEVYKKELLGAGRESLSLTGNDQLCKQAERALEEYGIKFNKGSVAKVIRDTLSHMQKAEELPKETKEMAKKLFQVITEAFPQDA